MSTAMAPGCLPEGCAGRERGRKARHEMGATECRDYQSPTNRLEACKTRARGSLALHGSKLLGREVATKTITSRLLHTGPITHASTQLGPQANGHGA